MRAQSGRNFLLVRLLLGAAVLLTACGAGVIVYSMPPEGTVDGVCREATTHAPLSDVEITLRRNDTGSGAYENTYHPGDPTDPGNKEAPNGWSQSSDDDSTVDLAGEDNSPRYEWDVTTDDQGRFTLSHIPAGEYTMDAGSDGHDVVEEDVVVMEGQVQHLGLEFHRSAPNLSFETSTLNWMTTENPEVSLRGLLTERTVTMGLSRVDIDHTSPARIYQMTYDRYGGDSEDAASGAKFIPVRKWDHPIANSDSEGSFYDRISLATDQLPVGGPQTLPPGLYRVNGSDGRVDATTWALVTRLALVSKSYGNQILAYVTDLATGQPVPGASVALYDRTPSGTKMLSASASGKDGLAHLTSTGAAKESQGILFAKLGPSIALLGVDLNSPGQDESAADDEESGTDMSAVIPGSGPTLRSFIYTERPVYRPGQTVNFKGVMRWYDRTKGFSVPAGKPVDVEIRDAQDTLISHQKLTTNDMGSWTGNVKLSSETLTGEYTIHAQLGGQTGQGTFDVAAYQKPEYQADIAFSKDRYVRGDTIVATVTASYYYGAPVSGAKASVQVMRESEDEEADKALHVASSESDSGEDVLDEDIVLDGNGQAQITIPTKDQPESTDLYDTDTPYTVTVEVTDPSGKPVTATETAIVAQGDFSLATDTSSTIAHKGDTIGVTVTATGMSDKPVPGRAITVVAEYQDWDWRSNTTNTVPVSSFHVVTGSDGTAHASVVATRVGSLTVRALATDDRGNHVSSETDIWVPGTREEIQTRFSDLALVLDKKKYQPGQTAHLLINTDHPGATALVTVEGATLYKSMIVPLPLHSTSVDLDVEDAYAPSVTVSVCCVTRKQFFNSSETLTTEDPRRPLTISIQPDKPSYHPGDPAVIRVRTTDAGGHPVPAELSVGVVDSAIYAIEPEPSETILDAMQPEQDDVVHTDDSCENVYYGDVDKGATNIDIRKRFPDTALWNPDVRTGPDGTAQVSLTMPDTLTTWRITCVGQTISTMVGKSVANMVVNKDLLVRMETPVFLTAGNDSTLVAVVHNNTLKSLTAHVHISVTGVSITQGQANQNVTVQPGKPAHVEWQIRSDQPGQASATVTVAAGALNDGVEQDWPVDPHGAFISAWHAGTLLKHVTNQVTLDPKAEAPSTVLRVRLSPSIASSILPAMDYLSTYPYGCIDSTVSAMVPDAILASAGGAGGKAPAINLTPAQKARLNDEITRSLLRLYRFQRDDGGWGWFTTDQSDLWMTAYATWGLQLAQSGGYKSNPSVLKGGLNATADLANTARHADNYAYFDWHSQALAALALAQGGRSKDALENLQWIEKMWHDYPLQQNNEDLAIVALAENKLGGAEQAKAAAYMQQLWAVSRLTGAECSWVADYHTSQVGVAEDMPDEETTAWCMLAAQKITPTEPRIDGVARWLISNRIGDHWVCPEGTAITLLALTAYLNSSHEMQPDFDARLLVNGHLVRTVHFGAASVADPDLLVEIPGSALTAGANSVEIEKSGTGRLYYSLELRQCLAQPSPPPSPSLWQRLIGHLRGTYPPQLAPAPSGYRIRRAYLRLTSRRGFFWEDTVPAPDTSYQAGDSILVRLIIDCTRPSSRVVIEEPVPAGCRIMEANGDQYEDWDNWWDYTDVRDDKILFFVKDMTTGEHEIDYHLQAQTAGSYDVMPPMLTSMVDPTLQALGKPGHIGVIGSKS
jgi:uncharacterized protein YfaS (alpha-2-macroglobulin family)